jgi:hypothetical protein
MRATCDDLRGEGDGIDLRVIERAMGEQDWQNAGARWQGKDGRLRLEGWSRYRRILILRRRIERIGAERTLL